jgi:5-formyltetrahydrofolate cyclo-ligase
MNKAAIRKKYKTLRQNLSQDDIDEMSLKIANKLLQMPVWDKTYFHVFLPITEQREVNTEFILHVLSGKDKEIIVSRSDFHNLGMTHFLLTENTKIRNNQYNIPEPVNGLEVPAQKIEVVFVPLLAYDKKGNRVGYGKGFYDRFLSQCSTGTLKIGLSFFEAEENIEPVDVNDIKLNYCITPQQIHEF